MTITRCETYDFVVAGGGLAGVCAAVAAARQGLNTCLIHERPVLGGVASSEMRVTVHGAACHHAYGRETGIIHEILEAERAMNHEDVNENGWTNSIFDLALYDLVQRTPGLTLHLNTAVLDVLMDNGAAVNEPATTTQGYYERPACTSSRRIAGLRARTLSAEIDWEIRAPLFADCSGDAFVADRAGCAWRMGSESQEETAEPHAPPRASTETMGNSIHIRAREMGRPCPFTLPAWAHHYDDASFFYDQGRTPHDPRGGYWWIEIGVPWHTIHDNETIRHELTRHALGVWNWMKNHDPKMKDVCASYALDFIGQVPGKRESRRVIGHHWLTENELQERRHFPDEICHGGWFVDLHTPGGLLAPTSEPASAEGYRADSEYAAKSYVGPYGIPLRSLIARDVDNLLLAGRCLSATRAALGTVRVMATTSLMGQAVGTAAPHILRHGMQAVVDDAASHGPLIVAIQQQLLHDGVFLPNERNEDVQDLARSAHLSASSCARLHGISHGTDFDEGGLLHRRTGFRDLDNEPGQLIALDGGPVQRLGLYVNNASTTTLNLPVTLTALHEFFDYSAAGTQTLAQGLLSVPPGESWVWWEVNLDQTPAGYARLRCGAVADIGWAISPARLPEHASQGRVSPSRLRSQHYTHAFRIEPAQEVWPASAAVSGRTRPGQGCECWRSDSGADFPAWLQLAWDQAQLIDRIELTFPGQLRHEVHAEPPFFASADIARDYQLQTWDGEQWQDLHRESGNRQRQRTHLLAQPVSCSRLRLLISASGGHPGASVSEIRCYGPAPR